MSALISRYSTSIVVVVSIILGFAFPQPGMIWNSYLTELLMVLMFLVTLSIEPSEIGQTVKGYPILLIGLFTTFVLVPLLAFSIKPFFSTIILAGAVLALCCPSAVVSSFWTKVFSGDVATALVMSVVTNLLSIVTIPATMLIAVGVSLNISALGMMERLAEIILIPMIASFLLRRFIHIDWNRTNSYGSKIELAILVLIIWGSIAPGVATVKNNAAQFALLNVFMILILATAFALTHLSTIRFGHKKAIAIEVSTIVKNAALSLVIAQTAFKPEVYPLALPPLIANLIAQNLLLIPAKAVTERIATNAEKAHERSHKTETTET